MPHRTRTGVLVAGIALAVAALVMAVAALVAAAPAAVSGGGAVPADAAPAGRPPRIHPDYAGVKVPPNIAPLNFVVDEPGDRFEACARGDSGDEVRIASRDGSIRFPIRQWRRLLAANRGGRLHVEVAVRQADGWRRYEPIVNEVAEAEIDPCLVYRVMNGLFTMYTKMSIRQRDLETFNERIVVDSRSFDDGCVNCHTFLDWRPEKMLIHMRHAPEPAGHGFGMMLVDGGRIAKVDTRTPNSLGFAAFSTWHPSGRLIAYSMSRVTQFFHRSAPEVREVVDLDSDMAVYSLETQTVSSNGSLAAKDRLESWPAWSADGKYLYFCSAPLTWEDRYTVPPKGYENVRYSLMRIAYDIGTGRWGELETVLSPADTGLSITQPRPSPDGRFMLLATCDRSVFPCFRPDSDLRVWEPATGALWRLECSSDQVESWHCWSSSGRWIAFTSKRDDTLFGRTYIAWVGPDGHSAKAFVLPQEDPTYYDSYIRIHQVPELVREPLPFRGDDFARAIRSRVWVKADLTVTGASPMAGAMQDCGTTRMPEVGPQ